MGCKYVSPVRSIQLFTPQEYVAVCFDFCCDAESYTVEMPGQFIDGTPYLTTGGQPWVDGGDYYDTNRGSWHLGSHGISPNNACHGTIASELWGSWAGQLSGTKDCRGLQVNYMELKIAGVSYTDGNRFNDIPSSALGISHIVIYITNAYGSAPEYHKGHTTPITNAS